MVPTAPELSSPVLYSPSIARGATNKPSVVTIEAMIRSHAIFPQGCTSPKNSVSTRPAPASTAGTIHAQFIVENGAPVLSPPSRSRAFRYQPSACEKMKIHASRNNKFMAMPNSSRTPP
jgi:hypothetical protein